MAMLLSGYLSLLNFVQFYVKFQDMGDIEENLTYLFIPTAIPDTLSEELRDLGIECETWRIQEGEKLQAEGLSHTASGFEAPKEGGAPASRQWALSIAAVRNMDALDYRKIEALFQGSDDNIDVNLLKWTVYTAVFLLYSGALLFFLAYGKTTHAKWGCLLLWICFLKRTLFHGLAEFPVWRLPGLWSDLEGWGALWESAALQASVILQFQNYPIIHNYYQALVSCPLHLAASLLLWVAFTVQAQGLE